MRNIWIINVPTNISITYWLNKKNKNIVFVLLTNKSKNLKINFNLNCSEINHDSHSNSIIIRKKVKNNLNIKIPKIIFNLLKSWDLFFFLKIKFKGKGFRIRFLKKTKLVKFFFGRSHKTFIVFKYVVLKKINKYKFILKGLKKDKLIQNSLKVVNIKPINYYTLRGLRKSKQIIFKRKGKKGTYI